MGENLLICMMGLPRSGKTTWAVKKGHPIVSPDAIRMAMYGQRFCRDGEKMVWTNAWYMVKSLFYAGHPTVIVDATNTIRLRRDSWTSHEWKTVFKVIDTGVSLCIERAQIEDDGEIIPIIRTMNSHYEPLAADETSYDL